jgi:ankyrin repeat protein
VARGADVARAADDLTEETPTQQVRKFVALDESQGLSPSEIHSFLYALGLSTESLIPGIEHTLLVLGDGDQSLEDPYDFVAQSIRHYTGKQSLESQDLNLSFRVSPIVREFAQLILDAKAKVVGGNVNKDIKHTIDTAKDDEEGGGILKFINERDGRTIEALRGNIRVNTLDTIIIIFAEEDREEARSIFADGNSSPIVIHARNTLGLEWNNVVLFKPFGDNSPLYRHKKLIETNYDASAPVPTSRPKNDHGIEAVIPFNEFYVAATRPLNGLYVFDHANNTLANLFETASTHIWSKSKDLEVESAKEQTLEELMAYIKNNSKVLDYEQILKQLISQAVERIEATTHDAKITKKYLTTLKQLIQETDSDLLNRVGTILKPILEAEIRAKAEAEKIAAEAKILAKAEANGGATVSPKTTKAKTSPEPKKAPAAEAKTSPEPKKASAEAKGGATTTPKTTKAKKAPAEAQVATATNTSLEQELFKAIKNNNIKEAERLLEKGANPNLCNQDGFFPLHMAVRQGNMEIVKLLLSQSGIMINPKDNKKNTPLAIAKEMQYAEIEKLLVSHQKLFLDIVLKDEKQVKELLKSGVNPNQVNNDGKTPLMIAVEKGYTNILKLLLEKGANAGLANDAGINTLHCAAQSGHLDIVELLLENGADINKASKNGATPLHFASIKGYYDITALLLNKVVNPSYRDNEGRTALHFAVDKGDTDIVKLLLDKSVDPNLADKKGNTALSLAVVSNNTKLVELLLEQKSIEVNYTNPEGSTAFHLACSKSDVSLVRLFLEKGADVTLANKSGSQPLHAACQNSNAAVVELLLATKKVDVNTFTKDGLTPLHIACGFRNAAVVNLLLQNNADIFSQDRNKQTALMLAKQINNQKIVTILENKIAALVAFFKAATEGDIKSLTKAINDGIHLDAQDANGVTPLLLACQSGHTAVVQALIENRANISIVNKNGGYALHFAAQNGHLDIVKLLLGKGANISIANKQGGNALHLAAQNGHLDIVKLLLGKGANINQPDQGGFTPLLLACQNGHTSVVQALLENRANISIANKQGGNALHLAAQMVHLDIVKLLLKNGADLNNINKINGATALHIAAADNNLDFVKFFLAQKGINIDIMDLEGRTPLDVTETDAIIELLKDHLDLFRAMRDNNTESIQKLLDKGVNPNQVDSDGLTPLHHAIQKGNMDVLKLLLKQKDIDVNAVNRSGLTILHEAIKKMIMN